MAELKQQRTQLRCPMKCFACNKVIEHNSIYVGANSVYAYHPHCWQGDPKTLTYRRPELYDEIYG